MTAAADRADEPIGGNVDNAVRWLKDGTRVRGVLPTGATVVGKIESIRVRAGVIESFVACRRWAGVWVGLETLEAIPEPPS